MQIVILNGSSNGGHTDNKEQRLIHSWQTTSCRDLRNHLKQPNEQEIQVRDIGKLFKEIQGQEGEDIVF